MTGLIGTISAVGLVFVLTAIFNPSVLSQQRTTNPQGKRIKSVAGIGNRTSYKPKKKRGYRNTHTVGNQASKQWPRRGMATNLSQRGAPKRQSKNSSDIGSNASRQWPRRGMAANHSGSVDLSPLTQLTHDLATSQRLFDNEAIKHPGKSATWIRDKVIFNLERDRR